LYALVRELGLSMGDLFAADGDAAPDRVPPGAAAGPIVRPDGRLLINLASGVTWERLTPSSDPGVEFLYVVYDVGSESCPEDSLVTHGGREYGYVVSGRLGIRIGFDEYLLGGGDSISFDSSSPHRLWAVGDEPVTAIWFVVGRQSDSRVPG
jgi:mannose-6-phosphate isomerase-like protein (cupin superfamily)